MALADMSCYGEVCALERGFRLARTHATSFSGYPTVGSSWWGFSASVIIRPTQSNGKGQRGQEVWDRKYIQACTLPWSCGMAKDGIFLP